MKNKVKNIFLLIFFFISSCGQSDEQLEQSRVIKERQCKEQDTFNASFIVDQIAETFSRKAIRSSELSRMIGEEIYEIRIPSGLLLSDIMPFFESWENLNDEVQLYKNWQYDYGSDGYDATYIYREICSNGITANIGLIGIGYSPNQGELQIWISSL